MIQGVPSRPGSQRGACEERWAVWERGCGVCVFLGLREVWGGGQGVENVLSCGAGRRLLLTSLPSLFWETRMRRPGSRESSRSAGTSRPLGGVTGSLGVTGFLFRTVMHVLCDCG